MNPDERPDEELNRIIAEWCGWTLWETERCEYKLQYAYKPGSDPISRIRRDARVDYAKRNRNVGWEAYDSGRFAGEVPNYCRDLNACHEAEGKLDEDQFDLFRWILWDAVKKPTINAWFRAHLSATARQRAEALVKVIEQQKGIAR